MYSKKSAPAASIAYSRRCCSCGISYSYNRIDYDVNSQHKNKQNRTIFLDPEALPYFIMSPKPQNFIHQSIFKSIRNHQYCNKSSSIEMWLQHFNSDWSTEYDALLDIYTKQPELGYDV